LVASLETTATCFAFTLYLLCKNPQKMQKMLQEIEKFKDENSLTLEIIDKCVYLEAVIKESLRLYPPGPLLPRVIEPII